MYYNIRAILIAARAYKALMLFCSKHRAVCFPSMIPPVRKVHNIGYSALLTLKLIYNPVLSIWESASLSASEKK